MNVILLRLLPHFLHHGSTAVQDISSRDDISSGLEYGFGRVRLLGRLRDIEDGEDGADGDEAVNVRRPVKGIKGHNVFALNLIGEYLYEILNLDIE